MEFQPFNVTIHLQLIPDFKPVAWSDVALCRTIDPDCKQPLTSGSADADGVVTLQILPAHKPAKARHNRPGPACAKCPIRRAIVSVA